MWKLRTDAILRSVGLHGKLAKEGGHEGTLRKLLFSHMVARA